MQLTLRGELAFVTATLLHRGSAVEIPDVLIDTGAASTVINADIAGEAGVFLEPADRLRMLRGVGGREFVFVRQVDRLAARAVISASSRSSSRSRQPSTSSATSTA